MRWRRLVVAGVTIVVMGGIAPATATATPSPGHRAERPAERPTEIQAWVVEGRLAAVRRSPLLPGGYGGHGVDYDPTTWPVVKR